MWSSNTQRLVGEVSGTALKARTKFGLGFPCEMMVDGNEAGMTLGQGGAVDSSSLQRWLLI